MGLLNKPHIGFLAPPKNSGFLGNSNGMGNSSGASGIVNTAGQAIGLLLALTKAS